MIVTIVIVALVTAYVLGIFLYDAKRRKSGKPSIFVEICESENRGKRLVKAYRKKYGASK